MKIPNFDDKDLAITGLVILGVTGFAVWLIIYLFSDIKPTITELFAFETAMGLGIAGLATGKKLDTETPPEEIEKPTV